MSDKEEMNWQIPCLPVFLEVLAVPPVIVKLSISKPD
jgi:hypothetical protein